MTTEEAFSPKGQKELIKTYQAAWEEQTEQTLRLSKELGNTYTGSLYNCLISLIANPANELLNKNILMFSYGSGNAATMFLVRVNPGYESLRETAEFESRLEQRVQVSAEEYQTRMKRRQESYGKRTQPTDSVDLLFPGTFYVSEVDSKWRRGYQKFTAGLPQTIDSDRALSRLQLLKKQLTK